MYIKEFDKWNMEKKIISNKFIIKDFYVLERELWWCHVGVNVGREQDGKGVNFERPVVILKRLSKDTFLIVPTSSKNKNNKNYIKVSIGEKFSFALIDQIKVIDIKRLNRKIGTILKSDFDNLVLKVLDIITS